MDSLIKQSWERFKFGGRPGSQQTAIFVTLKELPNNKFGTQSEIYWDDAFLNTQVGAITRGTYTLQDHRPAHLHPQLRLRRRHQRPGRSSTSPTSTTPPASSSSTRSSARSPRRSRCTPTTRPRGTGSARLQQDSVGFAQSLSAAVEENYQWRTDRGLEIVKTAIISIEYDENTRELLKNVQRADALSGSRGNANLQASVAAGIESAGENAGPGGLIGMGMATGGMGLGGLQQPTQQAPPHRHRRPHPLSPLRRPLLPPTTRSRCSSAPRRCWTPA